MNSLLLLILALTVPLFWGWLVSRLMSRFWPESSAPRPKHDTARLPERPFDYQI